MGHVLGREPERAQVACQPFPARGCVDRLFPFVQAVADAGIDQDEFPASDDQQAGEAQLDTMAGIRGLLFFPQFPGDDAELGAAIVPPETIVEEVNREGTGAQHTRDYN